jgi:CRP-like cAMP-binding protein
MGACVSKHGASKSAHSLETSPVEDSTEETTAVATSESPSPPSPSPEDERENLKESNTKRFVFKKDDVKAALRDDRKFMPFLGKDVEDGDIDGAIENMKVVKYKRNERFLGRPSLLKPYDIVAPKTLRNTGRLCYLQSGRIDVVEPDKFKAYDSSPLTSGAIFLMTDTISDETLSYRVSSSAIIHFMDIRLFKGYLDTRQTMTVLNNYRLFKKFSDIDLTQLCLYTEAKQYRDNMTIFKEGDEAEYWYIIITGHVKIDTLAASRGEKKDIYVNLRGAVCGPQMYFGEESLLTEGKQKCTATSLGTMVCLQIDKEAFDGCMTTLRSHLDARLQHALAITRLLEKKRKEQQQSEQTTFSQHYFGGLLPDFNCIPQEIICRGVSFQDVFDFPDDPQGSDLDRDQENYGHGEEEDDDENERENLRNASISSTKVA